MTRNLFVIIILIFILTIFNNNVSADESLVLVGRYPLELIKGKTVYKTICTSQYTNNNIKPISRYEDNYDFGIYVPNCRSKEKFKIGDNEYDIEAGYGYIKISLQDNVLIDQKNYAISFLSFDQEKWRKKPYELKNNCTNKYEFIDEQIDRCILVYHSYEHTIGLNSIRKYSTPYSSGSAYINLYSCVSLGIAECLVAKKQYKNMQITFTVFDTNFDGKFTKNDKFSLDYYNICFNFGEKVMISLPKKTLWFKHLDRKNTYCYIVDFIEEDESYILDIKLAVDE